MNDELFKSLFEIVTFFNRPSQDKLLLKKAGVEIDAALFPIIVYVGSYRKMGIGKLAEQLGRDYSTVSRQVDKLAAADLVICNTPESDGRVREVSLSDGGKAVEARIIEARHALMSEVLADWDGPALDMLESGLRRLAGSLAMRDKTNKEP